MPQDVGAYKRGFIPQEQTAMPILKEEPFLFPPDLLERTEIELLERKWHVLYTKPRHEKSVARQLLAQNVPFYLPLVRKKSYYRGRTVTSHVPVFSSYVFTFASDDEKLIAWETNRIVSVIDISDQERLRCELQALQRLIGFEAPLTIESRIVPGQQVRIKSGSMAGIEGTVIKRRGERRLLVTVNFLQRGVSIAIDDFMVEPIG